jgi:hypothetical protein
MKSTAAQRQGAVGLGDDGATRAAFSEAADTLRLRAAILEMSNPDTARRLYGEARSLYHQVGNAGGEAHCIMGLASISLACRDYSAAIGEYDDALTLFRKAGTGSVEGAPWQSLCIQGRRLSLYLRQKGKDGVVPEDVSAELIDFIGVRRTAPIYDHLGESKKPGYTGDAPPSSPADDLQKGMGDEAHDLNALAADLGFTFEKAAAVLTEAAKSEFDPLRRARRVVRKFERRKNRALPAGPEVVEARKLVNQANYRPEKGKTPAP